jgi:hypothetical protein
MRLTVYFLLIIFLWGCGSQREVEPKAPVPQPQPTVIPQPGQKSFADIQAITSASCLRCHTASQFLKSEAAWRGSEAKNRVSNNSMPPPGTPEARNLTPADRATLVSF